MGFQRYANKSKKTEEPNYEVIQEFGSLSQVEDGWNKALKLISWNGNEPKFDIRPWKYTEEKGLQMMKGITLTAEEIEELYKLLKQIAEETEE